MNFSKKQEQKDAAELGPVYRVVQITMSEYSDKAYLLLRYEDKGANPDLYTLDIPWPMVGIFANAKLGDRFVFTPLEKDGV